MAAAAVDGRGRLMPTDLPARVVARQFAELEPRAWFRLGAGDAPLVEVGDRVDPDSPILNRLRHPAVAEAGVRDAAAPEPGARFEAGEALAGRGRGALHFDGPGRVLYRTPGNRLRAVVARHREVILSPVAGVVEAVGRGGVEIRCEGIGLRAAFAVGDPSHGSLVIVVDGPDAEMPPNRVDVRGAGAVLVAGARVDVETITRARAIGVRGMIVGGMIGKDLRDMAASLARQEAALHASPPFTLVVLDGYGKRAIPEAHWECLVAAAGSDVGLCADPPMVILDAGQTISSRRPGRVRVTGGEWLGRSGSMVEHLGLRRRPGGLFMDCAYVALAGAPGGAQAQVVEVALADLEQDA